MFLAAVHLLHIKDLKDLIFFCWHFSIDMQVLTDLKSVLFYPIPQAVLRIPGTAISPDAIILEIVKIL